MSAILRAIRYADDASYRLAGYRKLDPITTIEGESRFLQAAEALFFQGESSHPPVIYMDGSWEGTINQVDRTLTDLRLATWIRSRDSGRYECHESLDGRCDQVFCRFIPLRSGCQPL